MSVLKDSPAASPVVVTETTLTLEQIQAVTINREKLSDWHHKLRTKLFPMVTGFFVRCRVEDSVDGRALYKIGRVKSLKQDWTVDLDTITADEIRSVKNVTNYDCISNSLSTPSEFSTWISKIPPENLRSVIASVCRAEERLRMLETLILVDPAFTGRKKNEEKRSLVSEVSRKEERFLFSKNVLLCEGNLNTIPQITSITELLENAVGQKGVAEPDTPRMLGGNVIRPRTFDEAVASNSAMMHLRDMENYLESPSQPHYDSMRLIETIRRAANSTYTEFKYDNIPEVCKRIISVCMQCRELVEKEPLFIHVQSPAVIFGDIHGNFADMAYFLSRTVSFGDIMLKYTTTHLLFLGDYVDRGSFSLECVAYLFALKVISPHKVTLLRGNHESPEVNGDMDVYGYSSFKYQCLEKFGQEKGSEIWVAVNEVFQFLPVIADIDRKIFCVHGGLPQYSGGEDRRLEILSDPSFPRIPVIQCSDPKNVAQRIMVNDLLWSDPAAPGQALDKYGFGPNPRGIDIKTFGSRAVDMFCERYGYQYIFRAHQEKADGLRISDSARVVTIFSTSDYAGHQNGAGCILVNKGKIRMCIKKPERGDTKELKNIPPTRAVGKVATPDFLGRRGRR